MHDHRYPTRVISCILAISCLFSPTHAQVTLYTGNRQTSVQASATRAPDAQWTGLPMYDPLQLEPPSPTQPPVTSVPIAIPPNAAALAASTNNNGSGSYLSIPQKGNFLGFSVELSVADSLFGPSGTNMKPEFLNYLSNIYARAGVGAVVRVGGNTQDSSEIRPDMTGRYIQKTQRQDANGPTDTPAVAYSDMLLYTMSNISALVHTEWYFGLAFNDTDVYGQGQNVPVAATAADRILGPYLKAMALGNEPDLYAEHGKRPEGYDLSVYETEWEAMSQYVLSAASPSLSRQNIFIGPSTCCSRPGFELSDAIDSGWLDTNSARLAQVSVQRYPNNNCGLGSQGRIDPQDIFAGYLTHANLQSIIQGDYAGQVPRVQAQGKEIVMLETNTASCGGFPGLSTSFGAAMWMTDWSLQLAYTNFSQALMHVGGQNVYYNPFTPPPGNMTNVYKWTTGAVYYSTLVVAEAFGQSNVSQIVDMNIGGDASELHPAYGIYENDAPTRVVLFNYVSDPSGQSTYNAQLSLGEGSPISQVHVRYLLAPTVSEHDNITWAGQTTGGSYLSDGKLHGDVSTQTITCNGGTCNIPVPAPAIAIVYLSDQALAQSSPHAAAQPDGFSTTVIGVGDATVGLGALQTSNGQNAPDGTDGRTNRSTSGAGGHAVDVQRAIVGMGVAVCVMVAGMVLVKLERQL